MRSNRLRMRKRNGKCRTFVFIIAHGNGTLMLFDNAVNDCETKAGPFADLFGGVEWIENLLYGFFLNANPCIGNIYDDIIIITVMFSGNDDGTRLFFYRLDTVDDKVDNYLFHFLLVDIGGEVIGYILNNPDACWDIADDETDSGADELLQRSRSLGEHIAS